MMKFTFGILVTSVLSFSSFAQEAKSQWNLIEQDCSKAKTDEDAHKCAEKIGKLNKEFRKSKCWEENEKYEAAKESKEKAH